MARMSREEQADREDVCILCGSPARYTVDFGDEAGPALRRVCEKCYRPEPL